MKTLYLECAMGVAGDMLTSALYELLEDKGTFIEKMNSLGLEGVKISAIPGSSQGIGGTRIAVSIHGEEEHSHDHHEGEHHHMHHHAHTHTTLGDVHAIISAMPLPEQVRSAASAVYGDIAAAESHAHKESVEMVHFHEVGALDAIADVVGACYAMYLLAPERIVASPVRTGHGIIHCAHGLLPVPAPATAFLLRGVPSYAGDIEGEMCTPTGAALIKHFAQEFSERPAMAVNAVGYGMGSKDFGALNCVRAFLGESGGALSDEITELAANIDDMSAEALSYAMERIMAEGALDVSAVPATMKKGRPGHILYVLAKSADEEKMARAILRETQTNGVRMSACRRMKLDYSFKTVSTPYGEVRIKASEGWDVSRSKPEYEDVARLAREKGAAFSEVWNAAMKLV